MQETENCCSDSSAESQDSTDYNILLKHLVKEDNIDNEDEIPQNTSNTSNTHNTSNLCSSSNSIVNENIDIFHNYNFLSRDEDCQTALRFHDVNENTNNDTIY